MATSILASNGFILENIKNYSYYNVTKVVFLLYKYYICALLQNNITFLLQGKNQFNYFF
jgi:hypothetical protein